MEGGEERIGLGGAAAVLDVPEGRVRRLADEGRLKVERGEDGAYSFRLSDVVELSRELEAEEVFEGEVIGDEPGPSRLPAVPLERYERLLQQGQDYKTRLEERSRHMEEIRKERDAARMEIDRLWSEIERLNLVEFQRELQERTISTLEEEKDKLASERERLIQERLELEKKNPPPAKPPARLEAKLKALKSRVFWSRLFGGG